MAADADEAARAVAALAACDRPLIVGVRHHSPACAIAIPALLDAFEPAEVLVELPAELEPWLSWLGHPDLAAPVALACAGETGGDLGFYPFADFSPELAAVRWAIARGVPARAIDLPYARRDPLDDGEELAAAPEGAAPPKTLVQSLLATTHAPGVEALWDRLVEAYAPGQAPEAVRRAALAFGWILRADAAAAGGPSRRDRKREGYMRHRIALAPPRSAAIVGAFHAPALLPAPLLGEPVPYAEASPPASPPVCSLVPYAFDLLDSRSGYPAGIRDPAWQSRVWSAARDGEALEDVTRELVVRVARAVRGERHVAGVPDASEAARVAVDLARLRGLPAPGRRELLEAIESALARGEPLGRGRVLARALEDVMVGRTRGRLAPKTPRSGLVPHVAALFAELDLPRAISDAPRRAGEGDATWSLDPLRSPTDRRRHVAFERMGVAGVPYAKKDDRPQSGAELLGARWRVEWTPSTEAMLELAGVRGVTLEQAAEGALRAAEKKRSDGGGLRAVDRLELLEAAARAGLARLAAEHAAALSGPFLLEAGLAELTAAIALVDRILRGHVPGLPLEWSGPADVRAFSPPPALDRGALLSAAVRAVEGLSGSTRIEDALALGELVGLRGEAAAGDGRLGWALDALAEDGSPLMQGAGSAARVLLGRGAAAELGVRAGSWIDVGGPALADRFRGALVLAAPILEAEPAIVRPIVERLAALEDDAFLERAPALRDGFDALSPAARSRMLEAVAAELGLSDDPSSPRLDAPLAAAPEILAAQAAADAAGRAAIAALGLGADAPPPAEEPKIAGDEAPAAPGAIATPPGSAIPILDRLRLVLGRERDALRPRSTPIALALDELYGRGRGEGSRGDLGVGGGTEAPFPSVRAWGKELEALFGDRVREEVLARAAGRGVGSAVVELDPDRVKPSVELLETILALKGGLPEADLAHLRRIVSRIVDELVRELSTRVRPALAGLVTPRPSRRPTGPLDLRRTVAANLHTARTREGAGFTLAPERLVWKTRTQRALDWHVVLVVDVSGSMEPSVIYSAVMAAILSAIPAVTVKFVAFNTQVLDLSDRVDDPLGLLLEVSVGGGTLIAPALRYARSLLKVPARSIVLLVTDFEEGESVADVLSEARALVETGCKALGLAALDDVGKPRFHRGIAELVAGAGVPVAALTPAELARWIGEQIR
ncbi:MAG: VWA domain-containing protein [Myxococcales bacterium]|nr:VWA domain-containing protein [Myxococcales bacterium]